MMARVDQVCAQPASRFMGGLVQSIAVGPQSLGEDVDRNLVDEQGDGDPALMWCQGRVDRQTNRRDQSEASA